MGKHRPLTPQEMTKEHLIPKSMLRNPKIKAHLGISFNPSDAPNIDISCRRCNNLKSDLADVPFVWKLQYLTKYGISLQSKNKLAKSINWGDFPVHDRGFRERVLSCIIKGDVKYISKEECWLLCHSTELKLKGPSLIGFEAKNKLPRKQKKKLVK